MRPPICAICEADIEPDEDGGLVTFAKTERDEQWYERARAEPGFVGTPPNIDWFCARHIEAARALSHMTYAEAFAELAKQFGES